MPMDLSSVDRQMKMAAMMKIFESLDAKDQEEAMGQMHAQMDGGGPGGPPGGLGGGPEEMMGEAGGMMGENDDVEAQNEAVPPFGKKKRNPFA